MKRQKLAWLIMVTVLTTGITLLPLPVLGLLGFGQNDSTFVQGAKEITDLFNYLSESYDKVVEIEKHDQLERQIKQLMKSLYKLEKEREVAVGVWLRLFQGDERKNCLDLEGKAAMKCRGVFIEMGDAYDRGLKKFRTQMEVVEQGFHQFGWDLRAKGLKGKEVERIISVGLGSWYATDSIVVPGAPKSKNADFYGPLRVDSSADPQDVMKSAIEESERCITALHRAQEAAREFLLQLEKDTP